MYGEDYDQSEDWTRQILKYFKKELIKRIHESMVVTQWICSSALVASCKACSYEGISRVVSVPLVLENVRRIGFNTVGT